MYAIMIVSSRRSVKTIPSSPPMFSGFIKSRGLYQRYKTDLPCRHKMRWGMLPLIVHNITANRVIVVELREKSLSNVASIGSTRALSTFAFGIRAFQVVSKTILWQHKEMGVAAPTLIKKKIFLYK